MRVMESLLPTHLLELRVKRYVQAIRGVKPYSCILPLPSLAVRQIHPN
jgi:hypothetical protein